MRRQLADVHEAGDEAIAALWASESAIYGRFGYGMATVTADLIVATPEARLRIPPGARRRAADASPPDAVDLMRPIHDAARAAAARA